MQTEASHFDIPSTLNLIVSELTQIRSLMARQNDEVPSTVAEPEFTSAFSFGTHSPADASQPPNNRSIQNLRTTRPALPDARLVRRIIRQRQLRARFFDPALFADPAWDMLLDLAAAHVEYQRVSVTSLCIASGIPPTTALRWIADMVEAGLFLRTEDRVDRRRAHISLSPEAVDAMALYFQAIDGRIAI